MLRWLLQLTTAFACCAGNCMLRWQLQLTLAFAGSCMLYLLLLPVVLLVND